MDLGSTSNPAFSNYFWNDPSRSGAKMTVGGIVFKSLMCILVIAALTVMIWRLYVNGTNVKWFTTGGMIGAIVISLIISIRKQWTHILVPLYTLAKGCFLGGITTYAYAKFPEIPFQAVGVIIVTFFVMPLL